MPTGTPKDSSLASLNQKLEEEVTEYYEWITSPLAEKTALLSTPDFVEPQPPPEIYVLWDIEEYSTLPWDGGMFDQPDILMGQVAICRSSRDDVMIVAKQIHEASNATIQTRNN